MTPAEKPRATDKKRRLGLFDKKAIRLPMPVARPARMVRAKANATFSILLTISLIYDTGQIELHCIILIFIVGMLEPQSFTEEFFVFIAMLPRTAQDIPATIKNSFYGRSGFSREH